MFHHDAKRWLLFTSYIAVAASTTSSSSPTSLPQSLQSAVPRCAWSCLSSFIHSNYPSSICPDQEDIDCLCSHAGVSSYSLGEAAFVCAHQNCETDEKGKKAANTAYRICSGQSGAVANSHTLLPTSFAAHPTPVPTTSRAPASSITSAPADMPSSPPHATPPRNGLQTSQIIGIAVACGVVALLVLSIGIFWLCMRRRRRHMDKLDSSTFSDEEFRATAKSISAPYESIDLRPVTPPMQTIRKDPRRGGPGGVGIAPTPIRYKAILPPTNIVFDAYPERPEDVGRRPPLQPAAYPMPQPPPAVAVVPPSPPRNNPAGPVHSSPRLHAPSPPLAQHSSMSQAYSASHQSVHDPPHYSMHQPAQSDDVPASPPVEGPYPGNTREPSFLLPAKPDFNSAADARFSIVSNVTQFEEDNNKDSTLPSAMQLKHDRMSFTSAPATLVRPPLSDRISTDSSSEGEAQSSRPVQPQQSSNMMARRPKGPSLSIDIPGKHKYINPAQFKLPPPPPRLPHQSNPVPHSGPGISAPVGWKYPTPPPPNTLRHNLALQPVFMTHLGGTAQKGPVAIANATYQQRKDSISRRGFSQPHPPQASKPTSLSFGQTTAQSSGQATVANQGATGPFIVNGRQVNYPSIHRTSATLVNNGQVNATNLTNFPPPPTRPPTKPLQQTVAQETHSNSSKSKGSSISIGSSTGTLLTKRLGSEKASQMFLGGPVNNVMAAVHSQKSSEPVMHTSPPPPSMSPPQHAGVQKWLSAQNQWSSYSPPPGQPQQQQPRPYQPQYAAYQPPPPPPHPRPERQHIFQQQAQYQQHRYVEAPQPSPKPKILTPTRRGDDLYLNVS